MKFNFPINNFSSGAWSPRMMGRTDTDQYNRACEDLTNFIPQMTGGASFRGGTEYKPFPAAMQAYINSYTEVFDNTTAPFGAFKLIPYTPFDSNFNKILIVGPTKWMMWPANSPSDWEIDYGAAAQASISSWYPQNTRYTVLGDLIVLTNTNGNCKPKVFRNASPLLNDHRVDDIDNEYITSQPWKTTPWDKLQALDSSFTLNPSGTTGSITVTANGNKFRATDVGSYLRFANGTALDGVARITGFTSQTTVTAQVLQTLPNSGFAYGATSNPASFWQDSAWSNTKGWPRTVVAHQGRLIFGGSPSKPDTLWGSRISNFFDFQEVPSPNTTGSTGFANSAFAADNSRPFTLTPNSPEASSIMGLSSGKTLTIHTNKSEIVAYGSNGALGPVNVVFESSTSYGATNVQPVRLNNFVTFVQATGRSVRDIIFNFDENQFKSTDLAFVADHLFSDYRTFTGIDFVDEMAKTEDISSILWTRTSLGKLRLVTLDRDYQVNAWAAVPLGGTGEADDLGDTTARVLSLCNYPIANKRDALYVLVFRMINGVGQIFLEAMQPPWELSNPVNYVDEYAYNTLLPTYTDCTMQAQKVSEFEWNTESVVLNGSPLKGCTVSVVADGNYIGDITINNDTLGTFTLDKEYTYVFVGFPYKGRIATMPIEQGGQTGVPVGRQKRINELVIRMFNTVGIKYGKPGEMQELSFREPGTPMNQAIEYFTGDKVVPFPPGYDRQCQVVIEQDKPYPCHIVAVIPQGVTYD